MKNTMEISPPKLKIEILLQSIYLKTTSTNSKKAETGKGQNGNPLCSCLKTIPIISHALGVPFTTTNSQKQPKCLWQVAKEDGGLLHSYKKDEILPFATTMS